MNCNQQSRWHDACPESDNIVPLVTARLELVPELATDQELCPTEVLHRTQNPLQYRKLYEDLPAIYFTLDITGIILSVNQYGAELLGYKLVELLNKSILQLFAPDEWQRLTDTLISLFKVSPAGEVVNQEFRLNCPTSQIIWVKIVARILPGDDQNPVILMVCEDITPYKRSEDALKESEQRFQIMANTAPVMLWMAGCDGLFNFFNEFWLEFTGRSIEQERGIGWIDSVHPDDKFSCLQSYYSALSDRSKFHIEYRLRCADNKYRWILNTGTPRFTLSGDFTGYIGCCVDLTERKSAEATLCNSQGAAEPQSEEALRLNSLKDEFLGTVSHELRTPLTNMKMAIQMLGITLNLEENPNWTSKASRYFQILNNECDREINLINNFLDLQKLDTSIKPMVLETIVVQSWLARVVELFQARTRNIQQRLVVNIAPNLPLLICDPFNLERIVIELLTNACKFSPPNEEVSVTAELKSHYMELQVTNTGVEISTTELSLIFNKFYRIPSNDPWKQGGTGLGLALVQKLTKYLGGTIKVESGPNCTRFTILLPVRAEIMGNRQE
jgi:PAS domain S-box-containing protein